MIPMINGTSYAWADITFNVMGVPIAGITAIDYSDKQEMENIYGAGNKPVSRGYGKVECDGSITLLSEEVEALTAVAPNGRIQEIPEFSINISFLPANGIIRNHELQMCRFKENKRDAKSGDMKIEVQLPLIIGNIKWV